MTRAAVGPSRLRSTALLRLYDCRNQETQCTVHIGIHKPCQPPSHQWLGYCVWGGISESGFRSEILRNPIRILEQDATRKIPEYDDVEREDTFKQYDRFVPSILAVASGMAV